MIQLAPMTKRILLLTLVLSAASCSAVRPKPFEDYQVATHRLRDGTGAILTTDYDWTRQGFIDGFVKDPSGGIQELEILFPGDSSDFAASLPRPPLFVTVRSATRTFNQMNDAFAAYADLLVQLAGPTIVDQETFDKLAGDLNDDLTSAAAALSKQGVALPANFSQGAGLLSVAATASFQAYIEHKRAGDLAKALDDAQPQVKSWADLAKTGLVNIRIDLQSEYTSRKNFLVREYGQAKTIAEKRKLAEQIVMLDDDVLTGMETLGGLAQAYAAMPAAHQDLRKSLDGGGITLTNLREFYDRAQHLRELYRTLTEPKDK